MQLMSVDSPIQNKIPKANDAEQTRPSLRHVISGDIDRYVPSTVGPTWVHESAPGPTPAHLIGALGRPHAQLADAKSPEVCLDQAKNQFAAGHLRQGVDLILRTIDNDRYATDACLEVLWDQPVLARLPNVLRHVLTRFDPKDPEYKLYQWVLLLAFHASGNRQMGLRLLGQVINSQHAAQDLKVGGLQTPTTDHWLRQHEMVSVAQADFWSGFGGDKPVGEGLTRARRQLIDALNLSDKHVEDTLPLVSALLGAERHVLVSLCAAQTLRLLELHAREQTGLTLSEDEVRSMVATLSENQRLQHLGCALAYGHPFHVSALLASGVVLSDAAAGSVGSRTCQSPYLVEQLVDSGMATERLADLLLRPPATAGSKAEPIPVESLEALLERGLSCDYHMDGKADGPTLLWEAVRRKDVKAVALLRRHGADCNIIMRVTHADGSEGFTTPGIYALAQGDANVMRAMRMTDAAALLPGIQIMLEAVRRIS